MVLLKVLDMVYQHNGTKILHKHIDMVVSLYDFLDRNNFELTVINKDAVNPTGRSPNFYRWGGIALIYAPIYAIGCHWHFITLPHWSTVIALSLRLRAKDEVYKLSDITPDKVATITIFVKKNRKWFVVNVNSEEAMKFVQWVIENAGIP